MDTTKKRYAFISYNHKDAKWAKWLQEKLESYKLPADIHNEFEDSRYLRPVFRDKTDLNTGVLANELRKELEESKYLVVICSPNSAKSAWVSDEVKAFIEMDRLDYIIPFIVSGTPHNYKERDCESPYEDECFPLFLRQYTKQHPELELLGISTDEVGKEKAFIRVVSRMLGVSFDVLWKRHERQKRNRRIATILSSIFFVALLILVWIYNQPFDSKITYNEQEKNTVLPYVDGRIMMILENDTLKDSIDNITLPTEFKNIPRKYYNKKVKILFSAFGYKDIDTSIVLKSDVSLPINRKIDTYGLVKGIVFDYNDNPISGAEIKIGDQETMSDQEGNFSIQIPLHKQNSSNDGYIINVKKDNLQTEEKVYAVGDNNIINKVYLQ